MSQQETDDELAAYHSQLADQYAGYQCEVNGERSADDGELGGEG